MTIARRGALLAIAAAALVVAFSWTARSAPSDFGPAQGSAVATQEPPGSCPSRPNSIPFTATVQLSGSTLQISDPGGVATGDVAPDGSAHLTSPQGETYDVLSSSGGQLVLTEVNGGCTFRTVITFEEPFPPLAQTPTTATTSASTTSTPSSSSSTSATPEVHTIGGSSIRWIWVVVAVCGGVVLVLAWIVGRGPMVVATTHDCDEELRRWQELQRACDDERAEAAKADAAAKAAIDRRDALTRDAAAYRAAHPGVDPSGDNSYVEDVATGERVTMTDVELQRDAEKAIFDEYRRTKGHEAAVKAVDDWRKADTPEARAERRKKNVTDRVEYARMQQALREAEAAAREALAAANAAHARADAACRQADVARRAYEECIRQAAEHAVREADAAAGDDDGLPTDDLPKPKTPVPTTDGGGGPHIGDPVTPACDCAYFVEIAGPDALDVSECLEYAWSTETPTDSELNPDVAAPAEQRMLVARPVRPAAQVSVAVRDPGAGQVAALFTTKIAAECWGGAVLSGWQHRWTVTPSRSSGSTEVVRMHVEVVATVQCPGQPARTVSVEASKDVRLRHTKCCCGPDVTDDFLRCVNTVITRLAQIPDSRSGLTGLTFMAENGAIMVYRPMDGLGVVGDDGCPCQQCTDTITVLDTCVDAHFTGDFLFGLCGGWFGINWGVLEAGGQTAKWAHYPGIGLPDTTVAEQLWQDGYDLGDRAYNALLGDPPSGESTVTRKDLAEVLTHLRGHWRRDCEPCPHLGPVPAPKDFSRWKWS